MNNAEHCAAMVREHDRDGYIATLFAPADKRDALYALLTASETRDAA